MITLKQGDCLQLMDEIDDKAVDLILCDLPYGTTHNEWDIPIDLPALWAQYNRIIKDNGAILLFSQMPFSAELIMSNPKMFRYEWIWDKVSPVGFLNANKMPLRRHENILVFYKKLPTYNPQKWQGKPYKKTKSRIPTSNYGNHQRFMVTNEDGLRYPVDIIAFNNGNKTRSYHPTQKPVELLEYLIKTYTNPGDIVLDSCMGSGSTGVAAKNTGRGFIGYELDPKYYEIAKQCIYGYR